MIRRQLMTTALALVLQLGLASVALAAPDFSGTWKLNADKGQNLGMMKAVKETIVVRQTPEQIVMDHEAKFMGSTSHRTVTFDLGSRTVPNQGPMGEKSQTVAKWEGDDLVVTWTTEGALPGSSSVKTETWALSADGKVLTLTNARPNKPDMVMVYEKQ